MPVGGAGACRGPSGSLDELQEYAHLNEVVGLFRAAIVDVLPLLQEAASSGEHASVEIEGRLGRSTERGFEPDIGKEAFEAILGMLEAFPRWQQVMGWSETQDVYYTVDVAPQYSGYAKATKLQVRTTVGVDAQRKVSLQHTVKKRLKVVDMKLRVRGEAPCLLADSRASLLPCGDARMAVSLEQKIPSGALPIAVVPDLVRIKQRKRFLLSSLGVEKPAFAIDATLVFSGKSKREAEQKQASGAEPTYEVEVECLEPLAYLRSCHDDSALLALSMILKLLDFAAIVHPGVAMTYSSSR